MKDKIRVGMIGAGFIGPVHVESIRRLGFVDVVALATSTEETAKAKARALSIPKAVKSYEELLKEDIDVVEITSPNRLHFPQAKAALEAGKHVVCDKPLAMDSKESGALVKLAKKTGLVNAVTYNHRFYPLVQESRAVMQENKFGPVYLIQGGFHQDWLLYDTDYNWRVEAKEGGQARAIGDIGTHFLDTIQFVTGMKIKAVYAQLQTVMPVRKKPKGSVETFAGKELKPSDYTKIKIDTDDLGIVLLSFEGSDAKAVMTVSQVSAGRKCRLYYEIYCANGALSWDSETPNHLWTGYRDRQNALLVKDPSLMSAPAKPSARYPGGHGEGFPDSHTHCARTIYEYIRAERFKKGEKPPFPTFEDGHTEMLLCDAILESNRKKKWVNV
ncbi:MAG: Gfo/Idh/MocA family oxidoreductase [Spirochaetes bacterium]|nr:Gfo/Idh/MocA family oxidoreductase [Spirochaetota bacterium]